MRSIAKKILEDEMSDNTLKHVRKIDHLEDWIIDAMIVFHDAVEFKKKTNVFIIDTVWSGLTECSHVFLNGIQVHRTKSSRDCDMFVAELRARIIMVGGIIKENK